jgi:hypothetical protein
MSKISDVNMSVNNKPTNINNNVNKTFLGVQEISIRAGVHPNTVRNKCLDENPDQRFIKLEGKKKVIEVGYASQRLGVDVNILLTNVNNNVNKDEDTVSVNKTSSDVTILLTNAKDEVITNLKDENRSLKDQLAIKDEQIKAILSELSDSRNQSNVILKNIQDNFLPLMESQQKMLEGREEVVAVKKRKWWLF